ncbi:MAG: PAS domain S-box protein [Deltaproteobacteria bacterium]|nr:PAS domain S-box protein [Deltaproteobacteria bacterium]
MPLPIGRDWPKEPVASEGLESVGGIGMHRAWTQTSRASRPAATAQRELEVASSDAVLDRIVDLALRSFDVEVAALVTTDARRYWGRTRRDGLVPIETVSQILEVEGAGMRVTVVNDSRTEPSLSGKSWVAGEPGVRFLATAPAALAGRTEGVLCLYDTAPRAGLGRQELALLEDMAMWAACELQALGDERGIQVVDHAQDPMNWGLLESAAQGVMTVNGEGRIQMVNARMEQLFGYRREELIGMMLEALVPERFRAAHARHRAGFASRPRTRSMGLGMDLQALRKDGSEFPVEISLSYIEREGETESVAFVTDITERKRLESQLLQSQKMEAVGRLAGGVAHDFNNLLTIITGYNRMMLDRLSPMDPLRGFGEEIMKAADRAGALTRQLLSFSRQQSARPDVLDVNARVMNMDKMLRRLIGEDLELVTRLDADLEKVRADPGQIEQVLMNLAVNARDAMPGGGTLTVETSNVTLGNDYARTHIGVRPGRYVMLAVSDTGSGMDAETKSHLFEPFFTTKPPGKGTGLGLSTVYGIVKQSGGDVWVYSEPGRGTTFKIYLPAIEEDASPAHASIPPPPLAEGNETVLVVEDEPGVRNLVREVLLRQGYRVMEAQDGHDALRMLEHGGERVHLLVTDLVMPRMSGRELAQRSLELRPDLRVIFMSGYTSSTVGQHGLDGGSASFLQKPFTPESLANKVRQVLDAPERFV